LPARVAVADPFAPAQRAALVAALDASFARSGAPGAIVGVWIPGEGSFVATRGFADPRTRRPMRVDDHVRVGSITKTFTATLLLILADERKARPRRPGEQLRAVGAERRETSRCACSPT
jgi:D-alanyl-D-alanine carboxypeptidase